jgi:hypothetical protein
MIKIYDISFWMSLTRQCNISKNDTDGFILHRLIYPWR